MSADETYDLVVIGGGSGGVRCARMAATRGHKVALVEAARLGGTCVNVGCIPKKLLSYGAHLGQLLTVARAYGFAVDEAAHDFAALSEKTRGEVARLNDVYARLLERSGVEVVRGRARFQDAQTVVVGERALRGRHIVIATGGRPVRPDIEGAQHGVVSDDVFALDALPRRVVVVGGGYIGVEMASILHGLGSEVTLVHRGALPLSGFDDDVRRALTDELVKQGIEMRLSTTVSSIVRAGEERRVALSSGVTVACDLVLFAIGRAPNTEGLGLAEIGVEVDEKGAVPVDAHYRTRLPHVFAIGDVTGGVELTPVALAQGMAVVKTIFDGVPSTVDEEGVPTAVFTHPSVATVGLTEARARERFARVHVYRSSFTPLMHTISGVKERALLKLVVDADSDRVVGVHVVCADAGEIVQGFAVALAAGATKAVFDATIGIHPTAAEELVTMRERVPDDEPTSRR